MDYEISVADVKSIRDAGQDFIMLDVREPWEFDVASIAGSKHIPMGDIPSRFNQELDPEDHIVVVCHHGVRSANVTLWMMQNGWKNVSSLAGGIDAYAAQVDPGVGTY